MTDRPQLPEAELAALADGSLPAPRAEQLRARIQESPELATALADQERAVTMLRALDEPAPATLHASVSELSGGAAASRRRGRLVPGLRRSLFLPAATAVAVAIAAVVVLVGGGGGSGSASGSGSGSGQPSIAQTAHLALASATSPPPAENAADHNRLRLSVGGITFPYYERTAGWQTTGARSDTLHGRRVVTVYYRAHGHRVGYAIVSGKPLPHGGGRAVTRGGVTYWLNRVDGAQLITWRQAGHTCVIAGRAVSARTLLTLADTEESRT